MSRARSTGPTTQCHPGEPLLFTWRTGKKVVSLCGGGTAAKLTSITYRYGAPGNVELGTGLLQLGEEDNKLEDLFPPRSGGDR